MSASAADVVPSSSDTPGPRGSEEVGALGECLAEEMALRWRRGERPLTEEYLDRYPGLRDRPDVVAELIYEEICLRKECGEKVSAAFFLNRFPQWQEQLRIVLACQRLLETDAVPPGFPAVGASLDDIHLLAELGRGAQGRVYLATQPDLADRPVVLKIVPQGTREHLSLARLQHTHIVPLYFIREEPDRNLRLLCMPYFGGATLALLLEKLRSVPPAQRTGRHILESLRACQADLPVTVAVEGPACQFLSRASYPQALCWIGACLADALQFAHERGLIHLDIKPSNVLLAADGQPMLLDFHLARAPLGPGTAAPEWLGGTPGYMAPEQQLALAAIRQARGVPVAVDARADVFALGLLLYEALGGALPLAHAPSGVLRRRNPLVTPGLADLLERCLAAEPAGRYQSAAELAADLRRQLTDQPLRGVPNRSPAERWRKWRRRRPHALPLLGLALLLLAGAAAALVHVRHQRDQAETALVEGRQLLHENQLVAAHGALRQGLALAEHMPFNPRLTCELRDQLLLVERVQAAQDLHRFTEQARLLYGIDSVPTSQLRAAVADCRRVWQQRALILERLGGTAGAVPAAVTVESGQQLQHDLLDLAILWTNLHVRLATDDERGAARREALAALAEAEGLLGPSPVLYYERQVHALALGLADEAGNAAQLGAALPPRTAWEHFVLGRSLLLTGKPDLAAVELDRALDLEPQSLWPSFIQGRCAFEQDRYEDAAVAFTACITLAPETAVFFYNRGLAYDHWGRSERALQDYDHALRLDPSLAAASVNRGRLLQQQLQSGR